MRPIKQLLEVPACLLCSERHVSNDCGKSSPKCSPPQQDAAGALGRVPARWACKTSHPRGRRHCWARKIRSVPDEITGESLRPFSERRFPKSVTSHNLRKSYLSVCCSLRGRVERITHPDSRANICRPDSSIPEGNAGPGIQTVFSCCHFRGSVD